MKCTVIFSFCFSLLIGSYSCKNKKAPGDGINLYTQFQLSGDWRDIDKLPVWRFSYDSIYYYAHNRTYAYNIDSLKLSVKFEGTDSFKYLGWVNVNLDTMLLHTEDSTIELFRYKKNAAADLDEMMKRARQR